MKDDFSSSEGWKPLPEAFRDLAAQNRHAVLLETVKKDSETDRSFLFLHPSQELVAWKAEDLDELLSAVDRHLAQGSFVAGYFNYECGEHFVGLAANDAKPTSSEAPLAWLGVFAECIQFDHASGTLQGSLPLSESDTPAAQEPAEFVSTGLEMEQDDYRSRIASVQEHLKAGHSYQVNFTDRICGSVKSTPRVVYKTLLQQQPVSFAAYLSTPGGALLSFSPELFFHVSGTRIKVRPMKGTWPRGVNSAEDRHAEQQLLNDEKNRSEHVTIVDLLRNDLGRICEPGSIDVEKLFSVERYNTLLQMTSTISGSLRGDLTPSQIFRSLFPSGSITGAPKRRTMEIIRELESHARGTYTGAIGYFSPTGEACFNVAIRTLTIKDEKFTLGVGGGITLDSVADEEYEECRLKGAFLTRRRPPFSLIETMHCEGSIPFLQLHLERLSNSAEYFGIRYDATALSVELAASAAHCGGAASRIRLELNEAGQWAITLSPLETMPWEGRLLLVEERTDSKNIFLHHKTTNRAFYERQLAAARRDGFDEVLCLNENSEITEGAISNIFIHKGGKWLTPALPCGVLPGVQRSVLLRDLPDAEEARLHRGSLLESESIFLCNALRGVRPVRSVETIDGTVLWQENPEQSREHRYKLLRASGLEDHLQQ